jgi:phosphatidylinositol kinase/protein kinase (PI-3  family)
MASGELIRVAILWHEMWHEHLEEASRLYFNDKNPEAMIEYLTPLHAALEGVCRVDHGYYQTGSEIAPRRAPKPSVKRLLLKLMEKTFKKLSKPVNAGGSPTTSARWIKHGTSTIM